MPKRQATQLIPLYDPPTTITIPVPFEVTRTRGRHSTSALPGFLHTRMNKMDLGLLEEESRMLGMSPSAFVRFVVLQTARKLKEQREGVAVAIQEL